MKYAMHHWRIGDYVPGLQGEGFTAAHWFLPEELQALMQKHGVETLEMAGLEGLSTHQRKATDRLAKDTEMEDVGTNPAGNMHPPVRRRQL